MKKSRELCGKGSWDRGQGHRCCETIRGDGFLERDVVQTGWGNKCHRLSMRILLLIQQNHAPGRNGSIPKKKHPDQYYTLLIETSGETKTTGGANNHPSCYSKTAFGEEGSIHTDRKTD